MKYKISTKALRKINEFYHNVAKKYRHTWSKEDVKKHVNQTKNTIYLIENGLSRRKPNMQKWHGLHMATSKDKRWNFAYRIDGDTIYVEDASHAQNIHEMFNHIVPEEGLLCYGFNESQNRLYSQSIGDCAEMDITNNVEVQNENLEVMKMIINMDNISYYAKLNKIKALLDTNMGFKMYKQLMLSQV